jgi:fucose 4-O-acetylase-like acetyltransferase
MSLLSKWLAGSAVQGVALCTSALRVHGTGLFDSVLPWDDVMAVCAVLMQHAASLQATFCDRQQQSFNHTYMQLLAGAVYMLLFLL